MPIYEFGPESPLGRSQSQIDFPGQRLGQRDARAMLPRGQHQDDVAA
jgi:hypothetical protein